MRLSLISVLVIAFSAASLISADGGSSTTGHSTTGAGKPNDLSLQGSSTHSLTTGQGALSSNNPSPHKTEEEILKEVQKKRAKSDVGHTLAELYRKGKKVPDPTNLNGGGTYVLVKNFEGFGDVTITTLSSLDVLMKAAVKREEQGWLVTWADRSRDTPRNSRNFILVKKYRELKNPSSKSLPTTEDQIHKGVKEKEAKPEVANILVKLYRKGPLVSDHTGLNGGGQYVLARGFEEYGDVTIKMFSTLDGLMASAAIREEQGWLATWAARDKASKHKFILVKNYRELKNPSS